MALAFWIVIISLCSLSTISFAIDADILESEPLIHAGTNITLNCIINLTNETRTAADVVWYKGHNAQVDEHVHSVLNDSVAQLHIIDAEFGDRGAYFCLFPGDTFIDYFYSGTTLHIGYPPEPVQNLDCHATNLNSFVCSWEDGRATNLATTDTVHYEGYRRLFTDQHPQLTCKPKWEANECEVMQGYSSPITVVSENALGNATAELGRTFDPYVEVRPNAPENIQLLPNEPRKIAVSWEIPADWGSTTSHSLEYWMQYREEGSGWQNISYETIGVDTSYTLSSLEPYKEYFVRVAAGYGALIGRNGPNYFGTWSDAQSIMTLAEAPIAGISNLRITSESPDDNDPQYKRAITILWDPVPDDEHRGPNFAYNVTIKDANGTTFYQKNTENDIDHVSGLEKFMAYTVYVTPFNDAGSGQNPAIIQLADRTAVPVPPRNVRSVAVTSTSISLAWDMPSAVKGHIDMYIVEWNSQTAVWKNMTVTAPELSATITDLLPATRYQITVRTKNRAQNNAELISSRAQITIETLEAAPEAPPQAVQVVTLPQYPHCLDVNWRPVPLRSSHGQILHYTVYYCKLDVSLGLQTVTVSLNLDKACQEGTQETLNVTGAETFNAMLIGLDPFTEYCVWMSASTAAGRSPTSVMERKKTSQGAPSAPTSLLRTFMNASIVTLSWEPPRQLNGKLSHYVVRYGDREEHVMEAQSVGLKVEGYTNYSMSVQACSQGHKEVACGPFTKPILVMTDVGVSMEVGFVELSPDSHTTVHLEWAKPAMPNGPISYYMVRYRPAGGSAVWAETRAVTTSADIKVDCGIVDGAAPFDFEVYGVNEVDGVPLMGRVSQPVQFEMCNISKTPVLTIALSILLPSCFVIFFALVVVYLKSTDFFKPLPDPYFIEAVLDHSDDKFQMNGRLLNKRTENETFDTLRKADSATNLLLPPYDRLSSKESTSTNSSTDQGIHDMDGFSDASEMRYVSEKTTSAAGSRHQSVAEEEKPLQGKHTMMAASNDYEEDDGVFGADGSVTYSRIAEADVLGAEAAPMLGKESAADQYISDGSEVYAQLSQVPLSGASATPPASIRGLADQRSEDEFGSQSTVSYHRLGQSGLTPITSVETLPSEDPLTYSRLSQGSEPDVDYSQLAAASASDPSLEMRNDEMRMGVVGIEGASGGAPQSNEGQGVAMSLPSVPAGSCINPQHEFIVATALAPGNHPHPVSHHDNAGYVTSPPSSGPVTPPICKMPSPDVIQPTKAAQRKRKQDGQARNSKKNLADSKFQSGSDSSLTDGEGYSTLGLAETSSNSHQPSKPATPVDSGARNSPTPEPLSAVNSGYVPHDIATPPSAPKMSHPARFTAGNGYVSESDIQSIPPPPKAANDCADNSNSKLQSATATATPTNRHIPSGLPKPGDNGYVMPEALPMVVMPPKAATKPSNLTNPYVPHGQMAGMGVGANSPPSSPPTSLNNNNPLPPMSKDSHANDPYVGHGVHPFYKKTSDNTFC